MSDIVLNAINRGGSEAGVSFYHIANSCGRKANLQLANPFKMTELPEKRVGSVVGTLFHLLVEAYYAVTPLEGTLEISQLGSNVNWLEARRLFEGWKKMFPKSSGEMGRVLATERQLPGPGERGGNPFGVAKVTGRCDIVVEHDADSLRAFHSLRNVELPGTGVYIVDYKTSSRHDENRDLEYRISYQASVYILYYEYLTGVRPKGTIFHQIIAHKNLTKDSFMSYFVPYPDVEQIKATEWFLKRGERNVKENETNPGACLGKYGACYFLTSGQCSRTNGGYVGVNGEAKPGNNPV